MTNAPTNHRPYNSLIEAQRTLLDSGCFAHLRPFAAAVALLDWWGNLDTKELDLLLEVDAMTRTRITL